MAAADITGVRDSRGQHTRVRRGNIREKLMDYIEQVFECKADTLEIFARVLPTLRGGHDRRRFEVRSSEFLELRTSDRHSCTSCPSRSGKASALRASGFQLLISLRVCTCSQRAFMNNAGYAPAFPQCCRKYPTVHSTLWTCRLSHK